MAALPADSESNICGVEFVLTDLDLGLTFMDVADVTGNEESVRRNHTNALHVYSTALRLLENLRPDARQAQAIQAKLRLLKARLEAVGRQC